MLTLFQRVLSFQINESLTSSSKTKFGIPSILGFIKYGVYFRINDIHSFSSLLFNRSKFFNICTQPNDKCLFYD